jgi:hypothetical protein
MAPFPSNIGTSPENVEAAWRRAREIAGTVKQRTNALSTASAAGSIPSTDILGYAQLLADAKTKLQAAASVSGIAAYAQEQIGDPTFDVVASFTDMMSGINGVIAWIITNFPKDGNGFLLAKTFTVDNSGRTQDRTFTPAQTATLRTTLASLAATIN